VRAINRLTAYLCEGSACKDGPTPLGDKPRHQRKILPEVKDNIPQITSDSGAKPRAPTPLHTLVAPTTLRRHEHIQIRDKMYDYLASLMKPKPPVPKANIRVSSAQPESINTAGGHKRRRQTAHVPYITGYQQYQSLQGKKRTASTIAKLHELYTRYMHSPEYIAETLGLAQATAHYGKGKKRKIAQRQQQACVRWATSIGPGWMVQVAKDLGYTPDQTVVATPADEREIEEFKRPCEICTEATELEQPDVVHCDTCRRAYHTRCCSLVGHIQTATPGPLTPPGAYTCRECQVHQYTFRGLPDDLKMYKTTWKVAEETYEKVREVGNDAAKLQLEQLISNAHLFSATDTTRHGRHTAKRLKAADTLTTSENPTNTQTDDERVYDITIGQEQRKNLIIHPVPINPHVDVYPMKSHQIMIRKVLMRTKNATGQTHKVTTTSMCIRPRWTQPPHADTRTGTFTVHCIYAHNC